MTPLLWIGAALIAIGVALLAQMARRAAALKRADASPEETQSALRGLVALNLAGVGAAFFGLALILAGLLLAGG